MAINTLSAVSSLASGDQIAIYSAAGGADAKVSILALTAYLAAQNAAGGFVSQYLAPNASGFTATFSAVQTFLVLTPAAPYAAATLVLPTGIDGGEVRAATTQTITALTITGGTVYGAPTTLAPTAPLHLRYDGITGAWFRV